MHFHHQPKPNSFPSLLPITAQPGTRLRFNLAARPLSSSASPPLYLSTNSLSTQLHPAPSPIKAYELRYHPIKAINIPSYKSPDDAFDDGTICLDYLTSASFSQTALPTI